MDFVYNDRRLRISRYPRSQNRSLRPWSAADEHMLSYMKENLKPESVLIQHDRFGFLTCALSSHAPISVVNFSSQEKATIANLRANSLEIKEAHMVTPLGVIPIPVDLGMIKIPKSLDLFRLYLHQMAKCLTDDGTVICGFMTRHFTPQILAAAETYFEAVEQSKAWKKSRLLVLRGKKKIEEQEFIHTIKREGTKPLRQYYGVFSADHVDYASQFLIEHLKVQDSDDFILDLASGNGVLASAIREKRPSAEIHLLDDSFLAVESSKLNLTESNTHFHHNDTLDRFQSKFFDLVVSNPPFHFEYETNIEIALRLFKEAKRCLKTGGRFQLVASQHLNFKTHLVKLFPTVIITAENDKFVIYECVK